MAETIKVLGQVAPSATALTVLYTVPSSTEAVVSTIAICNRSSSKITVRVSVAVGGATDSPEQYIMYDVDVESYGYLLATIGLTLAATDVVRVYASSGDASFSLFGTEIT